MRFTLLRSIPCLERNVKPEQAGWGHFARVIDATCARMCRLQRHWVWLLFRPSPQLGDGAAGIGPRRRGCGPGTPRGRALLLKTPMGAVRVAPLRRPAGFAGRAAP